MSAASGCPAASSNMRCRYAATAHDARLAETAASGSFDPNQGAASSSADSRQFDFSLQRRSAKLMSRLTARAIAGEAVSDKATSTISRTRHPCIRP